MLMMAYVDLAYSGSPVLPAKVLLHEVDDLASLVNLYQGPEVFAIVPHTLE